MKILFLTHKFYPDIGGIEVNSEILAKAFHNAGHEVHVLTWTEKAGDKVFPFQCIRKPSILMLFKQHQWADVVFENNPCIKMAWPGLFVKRPSVIAIRTWINRNNGKLGWQDRLKILWLNHAKGVIAVSEAIRKKCWPSAVVIGNPYRQNLFRELSDVDRQKNFVYLGRLVSDKGVDLAIKAFSKVIYSRKEYLPSLTIIGDGPEFQKLQNLASELGVPEHVKFAGALQGEDLVKELNLHNYMIVPSVWEEPFGNVALEGLACGCLPIVSDGGGLPDAVGNAGLIFKREDLDSLVETIRDLLDNPELEKTLRKNVKFHLKNHFPDVVSERYLNVIKNAIKA